MKVKIVIFSKRPAPKNTFKFNDEVIEIVINRKIRLYNLPVDCQIDLFYKVVITPVLLNECEIWGIENVGYNRTFTLLRF